MTTEILIDGKFFTKICYDRVELSKFNLIITDTITRHTEVLIRDTMPVNLSSNLIAYNPVTEAFIITGDNSMKLKYFGGGEVEIRNVTS